MNRSKTNSANVNGNVRVIRKKKDQKFKGSNNNQGRGSSGPHKAQGIWVSPRGQNFAGKHKPIWQAWGSQQANPKGQLAFISNQEVFGNDKKGKQWVDEQKKRQKEDVFQPGQVPQIPEQNVQEEQIVYIQPSVAEARLKRLREMGRSFTDEDFPPNDYSLCGPYGPISDWQTIKWRRTSFAIQNPVLIDKKIEPNDIKQGFLGDCYFLAGLASLAERPDRIFNLFLLQELNDMNYFSVKMLYRGKWRTVDIDDYVPFAFNMPAFGKSNDGELWVVVLEKAWAKIYGSYKQIQAGFPEQPLHDLTGAPIKHIFLNAKGQKYEQQWEYLLMASKKQYAMVASSRPGSDTNQSDSGIYQGHAYTFLNATILRVNEQEVKLVQLRNPWGKGQYKGKWSDNDPSWDQVSQSEKKRVYRGSAADDGIFFMDYDAFVYEFRNITIAQINDNASYVYESFYDPEIKGAYFTVDIIKPAEYSFQIDKTPQRSFTGEKQRKYQYPQAWLQIGKIDGDKVDRFQGYISRRRTLFKSYKLEPGKYVAWVRVQFDPNFQEDFEVNLAVYSDFVCGIKLSTRDQAIKFQEGDAGIQWTGQRIKKPSMIKPSQPSQGSYNSGPSIDQKGKGTLFNFLNRDRNANRQGISNLSPNSKIGLSTMQGVMSPRSMMKKKKIRTIEVHHTKVQITEENQEGQGVVTIEQKQVRKETIKTKQQDGSENIKSKEQQKKIDSKQFTYQGETVNKKEKLTETLKIRQTRPNGETMEKVQTQQHQIETMEVDDDSNGSIMSEGKKQLPRQQSSNMRQNNTYSNLTNPEQRKMNALRKQLQKERQVRDELKYQEPDSESNDSYLNRK